MSEILKSLDRLQKKQAESPDQEAAGEVSGANFFSKLGVLIWLGASISATVFSYHLGVKQGVQAAKAESPKQWLNYFSEFSASAPSGVQASSKNPGKINAEPLAAFQLPDSWIIQKADHPKEVEEPKRNGFTIQVITYVSERLAKEEVERLAQRGHKAFVVPSGKYFQVCIDVFDNKKVAGKKLNQLRTDNFYKAAYPGAYIKFLKK